MATEEDNFDIDIYGDGGDGGEDYHHDLPDEAITKNEPLSEPASCLPGTNVYSRDGPSDLPINNGQQAHPEPKHENGHVEVNDIAQKIASTDNSSQDPVQLPKQAPQTQGLKRKDGTDDRYVDPGATTALFISELHWWVTDDDLRGWANQSQCEDELDDITFSEHKVNGKSKGQAYVLFKSPQAATAAKQKIESFGEGQQYTKKFIVSYTNPFTNPFRTLPKDGPMRNSNPPSNSRSTPGGFSGSGGMNIPPAPAPFSMNNPSAGYRGNRGGGYNNRGGGMNSMPGYHRGGFQQAIAGGFQGNPMGGFQGNPMGGMSNYGGFQNRGGMMGGMRGGQLGMRGGRGGMNPNGMVGMPMGGMGMGAMGAQMNGMAMGMPQMGVMGMQGMRPSQISSFTNPVGTYAPSIGPTGLQFSPSNSSVLHRSPANPTGRCLSARVGSSAPSPKAGRPHSISSSQGPNWATLTQYSPLAASITPLRSSSQFLASAPPVTPPYTLEQSCLLKHSALRTGQTGFPGAQPHYNPAFFPQQQQGQQGVSGVADGWNPHGAKRTRQE